MNILPFVFAVLLILSYGATSSFHSRIASRRNQKAHVGLRKTELSFLRQSEKEHYNELPGVAVKAEKTNAPRSMLPKSKPEKERQEELGKFNPPCARINLFPLVDQGREAHPKLYETAAKLLRTFYQNSALGSEKGVELQLLDSIVLAAKRSLQEEISIPIETLDLQDPALQATYYTLLKGTKKCKLGQKGHPPLIDYFKIERKQAPVCIFDAHPNMLAVFFGIKSAPAIHKALHEGLKKSIDLETIIELTHDSQLAMVDADVWKLLNFERPTHGNASRRTLLIEDVETGISLRKDIQFTPK